MIATVKEIESIEIINDMILLKIPWEHSQVYPGQFFMLGAEDNLSKGFLLNRPFSVSSFKDNLLEFRIRLAGKFTNFLKEEKKGGRLRIIGPLGNYLHIDDFRNFQKILLIGGGIGIAPLLYYHKWLKEHKMNSEIFFGVQNEDFLHYIVNFNGDIHIYTEDGSSGRKGFVTDFLKQENSKSQIIACGPKPMYKELAKFKEKFNIKLLLEERMACGFGACLGCAVKTRDGYKRVCKEGPIFDINYLTNF
jgi:dihydroorotate dehydrogenase electron transfer subunit